MAIQGGFTYKGNLDDAETLAKALETSMTLLAAELKEIDAAWLRDNPGPRVRRPDDVVPGLDESRRQYGKYENAYFQITGRHFDYPKV